MSQAAPTPTAVVPLLQRWAETELRELPWRRTRDPWPVLVSEVMLQQTQVSRVIDRFQPFLDRFPSASACADAPASAVIELWSGLGYNRRAVNLWRAAQAITHDHGGQVPNDLAALLELPGVGQYTARALLAFAFEVRVGVVDTNVGRLLARWTNTSLTPRQAQKMADALVPADSAWTWNQSLFDFAVAICTKRQPACDGCPLRSACCWRGEGEDPASASAGVSARQSKFEGSDRQVRGRIVDALRAGPVPLDELMKLGRDTDTEADVSRIAETLIADGLARSYAGALRLP